MKGKKRTMESDILSFTKGSISLGVGSAVVAGAGGSAAGLRTMGGMMPPLAVGMMGGHAIRGVRRLAPKKRKKRRR